MSTEERKEVLTMYKLRQCLKHRKEETISIFALTREPHFQEDFRAIATPVVEGITGEQGSLIFKREFLSRRVIIINEPCRCEDTPEIYVLIPIT